MLEQGPIEKAIIEQSYRLKRPIPDKIANAPELKTGHELYYVAFLELNSCRQIGFSIGPIPWTAIRDYCVEHEIEGEQKDDLFDCVQALDRAYMDWYQKELERKSHK